MAGAPSFETGWLGYAPAAGIHDEAFTATGEVRPHWRLFFSTLRDLGPEEVMRRWGEAQQLIRDNGVTYNVYGDARGLQRPWQLDPVPVLLPPVECEALENGLIQRGRLLEALLHDLYGPQRTVACGALPPELVFAGRGFLRPLHGVRPPGGRYLHLYAANVARGADGSFQVLGDRTQSPSGAGYALENRLVLSRMLPDSFAACRVQRLALFFGALRDSLREAAPANRDNPRIVLLTPGPYNETYFEHAYLARYLGYTLAEGGDLTVRDNRVFLKVLGGLQPVDVILRRLDDDFCDPLELRSDSFLGLPGLVEVTRSGTVAVANGLGSGLLESPALLAFLPRLCRELLGEELRLPSVPAWWCGSPGACDEVLGRFESMVIKPALSGTRMEPIFGDQLGQAARARVRDMILAQPRQFVAQERLTLSTTPVLVGGRLEPRHLVLRAFLTPQGDSFAVMPGGLARVGASADTVVASMQRGGGSKDTWALSAGPVSTFSLLRPEGLPLPLTRGGSDLPSRAADNLFWLGRYAERAEGLTRLLRGIFVRLTERPGLAEVPELPCLLRALGQACPESFYDSAEEEPASVGASLWPAIHDPQHPGSLAAILDSVAHIAGTVRDRISNDMWSVLRELSVDHPGGHCSSPESERRDQPSPVPCSLSDELDLLHQTVLTLAAFGGLAMESVTRGEGWRFLDMGRKLERGLHMISLLRGTLVPPCSHETPLLEAVLEIADSLMTYRRRYQSDLQTAPALDLLLADDSNPRSLAFQLAALGCNVDQLPRDTDAPGPSAEQRLMLSAETDLRLADINSLAERDGPGMRRELEALLGRLALALHSLSDALTRTYLSHLQASRHLAGSVRRSQSSADGREG
jgi:uncharacterized circularly permuted ATP-grasp superfamily protein/uncharacterized alpha-E superfamily protein